MENSMLQAQLKAVLMCGGNQNIIPMNWYKMLKAFIKHDIHAFMPKLIEAINFSTTE